MMVELVGLDRDVPLVQAVDLRKHYSPRFRLKGGRATRAVDGISFNIEAGQTCALVGESGCGKSTTARLILGLENPSTGTVLFEGQDLIRLRGAAFRRFRHSVQGVFQDPTSSLDPRMRAREIVAEPLRVGGRQSRIEMSRRIDELMISVGLDPDTGGQFPHEFSGGQRQRLAIARALALNPRVVVLDEPTSSLDVSVRAQILNLLLDLQEARGISYLVIAHDLATVRILSDRVNLMYLGVVVESATAEQVFSKPGHPYTQALLSAELTAEEKTLAEDRIVLKGELPSPDNPPPGCRFQTRCPYAQLERCPDEVPRLRELEGGHSVACHYTEDIWAGQVTKRTLPMGS